MTSKDADNGIFVPNEDAANETLACPKCSRMFKNRMALRMHNIRKHTGRNWDTSKNFHRHKRGVPWTPAQRARFQRTMKQKALARAGRKSERIQIVYPDPREQKQVTVISLKFCPNCGEHLEGWRHTHEKS